MTLGETQVEAKKHKWDAERLPSITASTPKAADRLRASVDAVRLVNSEKTGRLM